MEFSLLLYTSGLDLLRWDRVQASIVRFGVDRKWAWCGEVFAFRRVADMNCAPRPWLYLPKSCSFLALV